MKVATLPKNFVKNSVRDDEPIVLPREEYEEFLDWKKNRELIPNKKTGALLKRASLDYRLGKNIAGPFNTPAEADAYLDSLQ